MAQDKWTKRNGYLSLAGIKYWRSLWDIDEVRYVAGDGVHNSADGSAYICILEHTSDADSRPGVGVDWELYWDLLVAGSNSTIPVTQTAHGFSIGDYVKMSAVAGVYELGQADSLANAQGIGFVTSVDGVDGFTLTQNGYIENSGVVPAQPAGTVMYLDSATAGSLTTVRPTANNSILKPVAIIVESGVSMWILSDSPTVVKVGGGGGVESVTSSDDILDFDNTDPQNPVGSIDVEELANNTTFINELTQNTTFQNEVNNFVTGGGGGGGSGGGTKLAIDTTQVTVSGTVTETALATIAIPAGTLGTNDAIRFSLICNNTFSLDNSEALTLRMKYGGSTISTVVYSNTSAGVTAYQPKIEGFIVANNASNAQKGLLSFIAGEGDIDDGSNKAVNNNYGTSSVDSTVSQNLIITAQFSSTGTPSNEIYKEAIIVEKISGSTSGNIINLTAGEDLTAGDTVGFASFIDDTAMKAAWAARNQNTGITSAGSQAIYGSTNIGGDKWAILVQATSGVNNTSVIIGELDRDTNTWTFGAEESAFNLIDGACIVKCDTDKFATVISPDGNNEQVYCTVYTVSGLTITVQGQAVVFNDGDDRVFPTGVQLDTDIIAILTSAASGETNLLAIDTTSGNPSLIDSINATGQLLSSSSGFWGIGTIGTNKVIAALESKASIYTFSGGLSGTWSAGANVVTLTAGINSVSNGIKSVVTDEAYLVSGTNKITLLNATGTTLTETDVLTQTLTGGSIATVLSDGTNVYLWSQLDGIYKIINTSGVLSTQYVVNFAMTGSYPASQVGQIQNMFTESDSGYFIVILGFEQSSDVIINFHVQSMTQNFIGIAQSTISRGGIVPVLISGVDENQTGLTTGALYDAFEGGVVSTATQSFDTMQAQSSTKLKI